MKPGNVKDSSSWVLTAEKRRENGRIASSAKTARICFRWLAIRHVSWYYNSVSEYMQRAVPLIIMSPSSQQSKKLWLSGWQCQHKAGGGTWPANGIEGTATSTGSSGIGLGTSYLMRMGLLDNLTATLQTEVGPFHILGKMPSPPSHVALCTKCRKFWKTAWEVLKSTENHPSAICIPSIVLMGGGGGGGTGLKGMLVLRY